jgi:hypothetical protein
MNNEFVKMRKEAIVVQFKVMPRLLPVGTEETPSNVSVDSQ